MSRHQFRLLVILNQLLVFGAIIIHEFTDESLPPELKGYLGFDESILNTQIVSVTPLSDISYWLEIAILLTGLAASIGLCLGQRWGRSLFLLTFIAAVLSTPLTDFYLSTGWAAFASYLVGTTEGMIIALVYFSPVKRIFEKPDEV